MEASDSHTEADEPGTHDPNDLRIARANRVGNHRPVGRAPRYRHRLGLGLGLLVLAAASTVWTVWGAVAAVAVEDDGTRLVDPYEYVRLGVRSILVVVLCAAVIFCATHPIRRGRKDFARLAIAEIAASGLLLLGVMVTYWLSWSPLTFLN